ncbi:TPA: hypothetical protein KON88_001394 [Clostridioides difficile]|nr:hypothetical protein [Clostridioides difficile]HBF4842832.1 hypothetical protein [Clostridioides difficile]HBF5070969.1 hypothetical protein [Clostridioides difficile]HBF5082630.1 hypothetical protein [Clostridioides difficile]HBF5175405.1 hypothetical protein [Clostridioides difficile]
MQIHRELSKSENEYMCTKKEKQRYSKCEICGVLIDDTDNNTYNLCKKCKRNISTEKIVKYINIYDESK